MQNCFWIDKGALSQNAIWSLSVEELSAIFALAHAPRRERHSDRVLIGVGREDTLRKTRGSTMNEPTIVVKPGEGRSVCRGGMGVVFNVSGADTGGAFEVVEHPMEPGRVVLPYVHQQEYSYILEGTIDPSVGDHEVVAGPGSSPSKPR
jgi:hypothetical protein